MREIFRDRYCGSWVLYKLREVRFDVGWGDVQRHCESTERCNSFLCIFGKIVWHECCGEIRNVAYERYAAPIVDHTALHRNERDAAAVFFSLSHVTRVMENLHLPRAKNDREKDERECEKKDVSFCVAHCEADVSCSDVVSTARALIIKESVADHTG